MSHLTWEFGEQPLFSSLPWLASGGRSRYPHSLALVRNHSVACETKMADEEAVETSPGILQEIFTSPLNLSLLCLCLFLLYKIVRGDKPPDMGEIEEPLPKLKKRDFTLAELKQYDGTANPRILMAVNGKVFDVTRGKKFYGPGTLHPLRYYFHSRVMLQSATFFLFICCLTTQLLNVFCIVACIRLHLGALTIRSWRG